MKQLIGIEYAKLKKLSAIKVLFIIYMIMVPLLMYFLGLIFEKMQLPFLPSKEQFWTFPLVWKFTTYCASYFNVLMGVIIVIVTCNEITFRTLKQNVIDGMSKKEVIFSKYIVIVVTSLAVTVYTTFVSLAFGLVNSAEIDLFSNIHFIFIYFLQTLCYFSFAFFFAVLVKKSAMSIIFFVLSFLFETIIGAFLPKTVYLFMPLNVFSKLTPIPFFEDFIKMAEKQSHIKEPSLALFSIILIAIVYMFVFISGSYLVLKKRDL